MYSWTEGNAGSTGRHRRYGARPCSKLRAVLHRWQSFETFDRIVDRRHGKLGACPGTDLSSPLQYGNFSPVHPLSTVYPTIDQTARADLHNHARCSNHSIVHPRPRRGRPDFIRLAST
jgi:hypothetical protein